MSLQKVFHRVFLYFFLFIWLCPVLVGAGSIFHLHCNMQTLVFDQGSNPRRPCIENVESYLVTGVPGKSQVFGSLKRGAMHQVLPPLINPSR